MTTIENWDRSSCVHAFHASSFVRFFFSFPFFIRSSMVTTSSIVTVFVYRLNCAHCAVFGSSADDPVSHAFYF